MDEQKTILDQVEVEPDGTMGVRLIKETIRDGRVIATRLHRTVVEAGGDLDAQMRVVNEHLTRTGAKKYAPLGDWTKAHGARAAVKEVTGDATLIANFSKNIIGHRCPVNGLKVFGVRERAEFLERCPDGKAFHDLVFEKHLCAADDAKLASELALAREQEAARHAEEAKAKAEAKAASDAEQARFDSAVANAVERHLAGR